MMDVNKEIFSTPYRPSNGVMSVLDAGTGTFKQVSETNVVGRFVKMQQLNGHKSRAQGEPVYDVVDVCQIKINTAASKDVVSHKVTGAKGEELKKRFSAAWREFTQLQAQAQAKAAAEAEAKAAAEIAKAQAKNKK